MVRTYSNKNHASSSFLTPYLVMIISLMLLSFHKCNASASMQIRKSFAQKSSWNKSISLNLMRGGQTGAIIMSSEDTNESLENNANSIVHGSSSSAAVVQLTSSTDVIKPAPSKTSSHATDMAPKKKKRKKSSSSSNVTTNTESSISATTSHTSSSLAIPESIKKYASESVKDEPFNQMPSIFRRPEEAQYDTYAACLAATESLRRIRDSAIGKIKSSSSAVHADEDDGSWKSYLSRDSHMGESGGAADGDSAKDKEIFKRAYAEYVLNSSKAINALGLTVSQFNQLGREVRKDQELKEKVMEQAYLYRMASTVKMDKIPLIQDPDSKQLLKSTRRRRLQMFVKSITEIEELRTEQMARLNKALNIDKIPANVNLCDPNVLPLLDSKVRNVIEAFPLQAEAIVKKYGLNSDEFNQMLEETKGNPVFRWRVQKIQKMEDLAQKKGKEVGIFADE